MKSVKHCRHVKQDGIACLSPALRGEGYCHSHLRYKGHRLRTWRARRILGVRDLHLPPPHDRSSILFSLNKVLHAITAGRLDPDEASRVLHELSLAGAKLGGGASRDGIDEGKALLEDRKEEEPWQ